MGCVQVDTDNRFDGALFREEGNGTANCILKKLGSLYRKDFSWAEARYAFYSFFFTPSFLYFSRYFLYVYCPACVFWIPDCF